MCTVIACTPAPKPIVVAPPGARKAIDTSQLNISDLKYQLPNGLTVIVQENHAAKVVALQMWVNVGSADEQPGEYGLAHVQEHMLFGDKQIQSYGGEIGAWTVFDQTVFHLELASRYFDQGLATLAEALQHPSFDNDALKKVLATMRQELHRAQLDPARRLSLLLFDTAYAQHPYRRSILGSDEVLGKITRDQALDFYRRWYTPDRMTLVIVGDVNPAQVEARVAAAFRDFKKLPVAKVVPRPVEPTQTAPRVNIVSEDVSQAYIAAAWHVPGLDHKDIFPLEVLAVVLGQGESSRLATRLTQEKGLANETYGFAYVPKDPGLFTVGLTATASKAKEAASELLKEVYRIRSEAISEAEVKKAKLIISSDTFYQKETMQGIARKLGFFESIVGDAGFETRYDHEIENVTPADVRRVANKYLTTSNLSVAALLPRAQSDALKADDLLAAAATLESSVARSTALTKPGPLNTYKIVLPSGAIMLIQEDHTVPVVALRAAFAGGIRYEDRQNNGINHLLAQMMAHGTKHRSRSDIVNALDGLAGGIEGFSGNNAFGLRGEFLKATFNDGLELFADVLNNPVFTQEELDRERPVVLEDIRDHDDELSSVALDLFTSTLYDNHPYHLKSRGAVTTVSSLHASDLADFYKKHYSRDRMVLAIVGDIYPEHVLPQLQRLFGAPTEKLPATPPPSVDPVPATPRSVEKIKDKNQAHLVFGFRGTTLNSADRYPLEVISTILSGPSSRLFTELAAKKSTPYNVSSFAIEGTDPGYFATYVALSPDHIDDAVACIKSEIERIAGGGASFDEINHARDYLLGNHAMNLQKAGARAASLALNEVNGLGYADDAAYDERIGLVTPSDLAAAAKTYLDFGHSVLAVVRPKPAEPKPAASQPAGSYGKL